MGKNEDTFLCLKTGVGGERKVESEEEEGPKPLLGIGADSFISQPASIYKSAVSLPEDLAAAAPGREPWPCAVWRAPLSEPQGQTYWGHQPPWASVRVALEPRSCDLWGVRLALGTGESLTRRTLGVPAVPRASVSGRRTGQWRPGVEATVGEGQAACPPPTSPPSEEPVDLRPFPPGEASQERGPMMSAVFPASTLSTRAPACCWVLCQSACLSGALAGAASC